MKQFKYFLQTDVIPQAVEIMINMDHIYAITPRYNTEGVLLGSSLHFEEQEDTLNISEQFEFAPILPK